ncbi:histidine kinase [Zunongwangia pacifica]|uniref:Histidine kinase n=1 Tax=Zunongwangia pacifica TaxID=2911062 RepID=A0A9X2CN69_9FLAO|nr:histidine kinase [Zunongwangia pacifica]MCL6220260.1 histidine kinase [Zunongwangia pacifica]
MPISLRTILVLLSLFFSLNFFCQTQNSVEFGTIDSLISTKKYRQAKRKITRFIGQQIPDSLNAKAHLYLGKIELLTGNLDVALSEYFKAKEHLDYLDIQDKINLFSGVGVIYSKSKNFEDAILNFREALQYAKKDIDRLKILVNLGGVSMEAGKGQVDQIYEEALEIAAGLKEPRVEAIIYTNLSNYYINQKSWKSAIESAQRSLRIRDSLKMPVSVITLNNLGYGLVNNGDINEGIKNYNKALEYANLQEKVRLLYNLRSANMAAGEYQKALEYYDRYDSVKNIVASKNYEQKIADIRAAYETAEKEKKIALLEAENKIRKRELVWIVMVSSFLLILLGIGVYFRMKHLKVRQKLEQSRLRSKFLRLQLNPHFLFNALQQVQFYIYRNERETSMQYLDHFGKLIRSVLEYSDSDFIKLSDEIAMLENYLSLQENAIAADFSFKIDCDPSISPEEISIPVMLLQPFVENAVIHGAKSRPENARVEVIFKRTKAKDKIAVEIIDNGTGIQNERGTLQHNKLHKSMGQDILSERMKELKTINQIPIDLNIDNASDHKKFPGTRVSLVIPYVHL